MSRDLEGRIALVTGASRGIGRAVAVALGARGARVVVNYTSNEAAAGSYDVRITSAAPETGQRTKEEYKIGDVNAKLVVASR